MPNKNFGNEFGQGNTLVTNHNHGLSQSSFQTDGKASLNPFLKGPKLHLFKKNRRLKTSSAARELPAESS
jgi:hypothetical protein